MSEQREIEVGNLKISNELPFTLFGGMNVLESRELALEIAAAYKEITQKLDIPYIFKASFDKANRSSITSFRGPGLEKGCEILAEIKATYDVPVVSDIHEPFQAKPAAEVIDVLQLPAFLCRQTDLVVALAETGRPINVKKAQFLAAHEMGHIITKFKEAGNDQVLLCERGSSFGWIGRGGNELCECFLSKSGLCPESGFFFDEQVSANQPLPTERAINPAG